MIKLCVYVTNNCNACKRVVEMLKELSTSDPAIRLSVINVKDTSKRVSIVPAVFLNEKLYSLGEVKRSALKIKINQISESNRK